MTKILGEFDVILRFNIRVLFDVYTIPMQQGACLTLFAVDAFDELSSLLCSFVRAIFADQTSDT